MFNSFIDLFALDLYNKIPISLFEISKLDISMISGFLDLLLMAFINELIALLANAWPN